MVLIMVEMLIKSLVWFLAIANIAVAYAIPCLYVYHNGRLFRGVLYSWVFQVVFMILMSIAIPDLLAYGYPDYKDIIYKNFPDARNIVAAFCSGWIFALIICWIAKLFYKKWNNSAARQSPQSESKGSERNG